MVRASITSLENCVDAYEIKEELAHADHLAIQCLVKEIEALYTEFRQYHYSIVELQENEANIEEEQVALDDCEEKVTNLIDRLQQLVLETKEGRSLLAFMGHSLPLHTQLSRIEKRTGIVSDRSRSLTPGPEINQCLLRQLEE